MLFRLALGVSYPGEESFGGDRELKELEVAQKGTRDRYLRLRI